MSFNPTAMAPSSSGFTPHPLPDTRASASATVDAAGRLVLRVLDRGGDRARPFLARRAEHAVRRLPEGPERRHLGHVLRAALTLDADVDDRTVALVAWAGHLESRGLLDWAGTVYARARTLHPDDPELTLHAARVARKRGDIGAARALYRRVERLDDPSGRLARMAGIGQALLHDEPRAALGRALRTAVRAGDPEAAAVAQEARAALRRDVGEVDGALRDYLGAAVRYGHRADLGRVGHEAADMLLAARDPLAARELLLATVESAHPAQAERARARLHGIARTVGDDLGQRRWAEGHAPSLVSLSLGPGRQGGGPSRARLVRRALERLRSL